MKRLLAVLLLCLLVACNGIAEERSVNSITVDLTPLRKWLAHPEGERPLKHWKQLRLAGLVSAVGGQVGDQYAVSGGDDSLREIFIVNVPKDIKQYLQLAESKWHVITAERAQIEARKSELEHLETQVSDYNFESPAGAPVLHVREQAHQDLRDRQKRLDSLIADYDKFTENSESKSTVLCMFTGRMYPTKSGRIQIWDCGR